MSGTTASWFGRPQAIKKAAGNAAKRGTNASNTLRIIPSGTTLFRQSGMPWVPFTYCEKRSGPTRSQFDALPLHRRSNRRITRGSPTGRRGYDQTTTGVSNPRKSRGPTLCSVRRIHPFTDDALLCSLRNKPDAIGRTTHQRLLVWTTTTPLLRPEASQGNTSNKPLWSSPCLRCSLVRWRQSSQ